MEYRNQLQKEKLIPHDIPSEVWSKVGTDLFTLRNKDYLIIADYNTKFFEISELPDTLATTVVSLTKNVFARFGIPKSIVSDDSQFVSQEYKLFSQQWDFNHRTSSPEYPKSNGFIERTIQTVKRSLKKAMVNKEDPALALLALRTTPGKDNTTPARKLMGRTLRTNLYHQSSLFSRPQDPQQCRKQPLLITMLALRTDLYFTLVTTYAKNW